LKKEEALPAILRLPFDAKRSRIHRRYSISEWKNKKEENLADLDSRLLT